MTHKSLLHFLLLLAVVMGGCGRITIEVDARVDAAADGKAADLRPADMEANDWQKPEARPADGSAPDKPAADMAGKDKAPPDLGPIDITKPDAPAPDAAKLDAAPILKSLALTPANPTIPKGATKQFTATGTYNDNTTKDLTKSVSWSSSSSSVAKVT